MPGADPDDVMGIPKRYFSSLVRWYWPYLKPYRGLLVSASLAMTVVLVAQATIPLVTSNILTPPIGGAGALSALAALIVAELLFTTVGERMAFLLSARSAGDLRVRIFAALLSTRNLAQPRLFRSSLVSRHTTDVDHLSLAVERTVTQGIPGVVQVVVGLILLSYVDLLSGAAMALVTVGFLIARARVGNALLVRDRARLDASSAVGELVDEVITMTAPIAGLRLERWTRLRFRSRVRELQEATLQQSVVASNLGTVAAAAGLLGLFVVMLSASVIGQQQIALVAAALLYIMNIVGGLAKLPPWVRELQLAVVSRRRIDQILVDAADAPAVTAALADPTWRELAEGGEVGRGAVGLVTAHHLDADHVLTALTGAGQPSAWRVSLFGTVVRKEGQRPGVVAVPDDQTVFNASVREHFHAVDEDLDDDTIDGFLTQVGLRLPCGPDVPLGPGGSLLTSHERAKLLLAIALAARPQVLLLGPLPLLADIDTAGPLLSAVTRAQCDTVVVAVGSPEVAATMDRILYVSPDRIEVGTHAQLLASSEQYAHQWSARVLGGQVDFTELGVADDANAGLRARLVTEHFHPGEVMYRQGDVADRMLFIISGRVEISVADGEERRRVAVLGPGNHCGDLQLTAGQARAETAVALEEVVVRSLTRGAYAAGVMGLLDRPEAQRRVIAELLRSGPSSPDDLVARLPGLTADQVWDAITVLCGDGSVVDSAGMLRVVLKRRVKQGLADIHGKLLDL